MDWVMVTDWGSVMETGSGSGSGSETELAMAMECRLVAAST